MEVTVTADSSKIQSVQQKLEDAIVATVPNDQKCRMLFHLAKDNDYGASEGHARYQRAPHNPRTWVWMAIIELHPEFERMSGLFMDVKARAVKEIIRTTGCRCVNLSQSHPKHIYLYSEDLDTANRAIDAVKARVQWTMDEYQRRRNHW